MVRDTIRPAVATTTRVTVAFASAGSAPAGASAGPLTAAAWRSRRPRCPAPGRAGRVGGGHVVPGPPRGRLLSFTLTHKRGNCLYRPVGLCSQPWARHRDARDLLRFAPSLDTPAHIELAESLGYRRAWCYDSPAVCADPWMVLAVTAGRTSAIGLRARLAGIQPAPSGGHRRGPDDAGRAGARPGEHRLRHRPDRPDAAGGAAAALGRGRGVRADGPRAAARGRGQLEREPGAAGAAGRLPGGAAGGCRRAGRRGRPAGPRRRRRARRRRADHPGAARPGRPGRPGRA